MTKLGIKKINLVRCLGGNIKRRALRLDHGSFSWGSEAISRKSRIVSVVYNASNNELVRTNTLVKSAIIQIDAQPFRQWYITHYGIDIAKLARDALKRTKVESTKEGVKVLHVYSHLLFFFWGGSLSFFDWAHQDSEKEGKSASVLKKQAQRNKDRVLDHAIGDQFRTGRLYACISSRPGQSGRADGYVLEGEELRFYMRKLQKKGKRTLPTN